MGSIQKESKTIRALRYHGNKDIRLENIPEPICRAGFIKIQNSWCGICGSDLHEYHEGPKLVPTTPHIITGESLPCTLGHEMSGIITELGNGVTGLSVGDRVVIETIISDGTCYGCNLHTPGLCSQRGFIGYSGYGGGFAESICVPSKSVFKLPKTIPMDVGALVEPLAVAWHAVKISGIKSGESALILGGGPIGLAALLCLKAFGISSILVSELSPNRSLYAKQFGASRVLNPLKDDVPTVSKEFCEDLGPNVVFDCAGVQQSMDAAFASVRVLGSIINLAMWKRPATVNANLFLTKQLKWIGSAVYAEGEFQEVIDAIESGKIDRPERLVTSRISLEDSITKGFATLLDGRDTDVKILVSPKLGIA